MENELPPRPPEEADLIALCRELNRLGAEHIIVGGMANVFHGFLRATESVDILIEPSQVNRKKVLRALEILPDQAVKELDDHDLTKYSVVRIADEVVVDLMVSAAGITYDEVRDDIVWQEIEGVRIPFASARAMLRMKQTLREKDSVDVAFFERKLREEKPGPR